MMPDWLIFLLVIPAAAVGFAIGALVAWLLWLAIEPILDWVEELR